MSLSVFLANISELSCMYQLNLSILVDLPVVIYLVFDIFLILLLLDMVHFLQSLCLFLGLNLNLSAYHFVLAYLVVLVEVLLLGLNKMKFVSLLLMDLFMLRSCVSTLFYTSVGTLINLGTLISFLCSDTNCSLT